MLILRVKQAECALADGRLDEAFELLRAPDLRSHRRGQDLTSQLVTAMVRRGTEHFTAGRLGQAMADCEKASRLGGNLAEVAELRAMVARALVARQCGQQHRHQRLAAARDQIARGQLSAGAGILEAVMPPDELQEDDGQARALREDLAIRRSTADAALAKAAAALGRDDWEAAIEQLVQARQLHGSDERVGDLLTRISRLVGEKLQEAMTEGRLDLAELLLQRLRRLGEQTLDVQQAASVLEQCRQAWACVDRAKPREAEQILRRLASVLPHAKWIDQTLSSVTLVSQAIDQVRGGPLGFLANGGGNVAQPHASEQAYSLAPRVAPTALPAPAGQPTSVIGFRPEAPMAGAADAGPATGGALPARFLLQVDGAGSFCVLSGDRVKVGPANASAAPDLGLLAEPGLPAVTIERAEDDYFLRAAGPVSVNERTCTSKLLGNGDRIALSRRCRIGFRLPNPASTSAVLDLSGARFPRADVRRAILLDREIILGPGASAHVRIDELPEPVVLQIRDGRLWCQAKTEVTINGQAAGQQAEIGLGAHVRVGFLAFVITPG